MGRSTVSGVRETGPSERRLATPIGIVIDGDKYQSENNFREEKNRHPERSEGSGVNSKEILRFAQDDRRENPEPIFRPILSERSETASMFAAESCPRQAWARHPFFRNYATARANDA